METIMQQVGEQDGGEPTENESDVQRCTGAVARLTVLVELTNDVLYGVLDEHCLDDDVWNSLPEMQSSVLCAVDELDELIVEMQRRLESRTADANQRIKDARS